MLNGAIAMHEKCVENQENANSKIVATEEFMTNVASPTLARLIEEVKNDNQSTLHAYDRVHNRHNR